MEDYHKTDHAWNIVFEDSETWANGLVGAMPSHTVGSSISLEFFFQDRYNDSDPPFPKDSADRAQVLIDHGRFAGAFALNRDQSTSEVLFREQHNGPSLVVLLEPEYDSHLQTGVWAIIESVEDATVFEQTACRVTLSVTVLDYATEYDDHADVRRNLEMRGI